MKNINPHFTPPLSPSQPPTSEEFRPIKTGGFPKVVAGGRIVRPDHNTPYLERMVTGKRLVPNGKTSQQQAILDSVSSNLEAGIKLVDVQETALAKIGGKLADISLALTQCKTPGTSLNQKSQAQIRLSKAKSIIEKISESSHDNTALFSNGPARCISVAVPAKDQWEGISIDRANISQPGLIVVQNGKVHGESQGYFLDSGSIKRAFNEWRSLCINNRMQWGLLMDRLHGVHRKLAEIKNGLAWEIPKFPSDPQSGPLRRPNRNN